MVYDHVILNVEPIQRVILRGHVWSSSMTRSDTKCSDISAAAARHGHNALHNGFTAIKSNTNTHLGQIHLVRISEFSCAPVKAVQYITLYSFLLEEARRIAHSCDRTLCECTCVRWQFHNPVLRVCNWCSCSSRTKWYYAYNYKPYSGKYSI